VRRHNDNDYHLCYRVGVKKPSIAVAASVAVLVALALAGCSGGSTSTPSGKFPVVASTNVWGDIAKQVGGDQVEVTSIVTDPDQDPHEFQADARNQLAVSKAYLIIENGGGYDDFMGTMISASKNTTATLIDAAKVSGKNTSSDTFNEHLWYDMPTVQKVASSLVPAFARIDPKHAAYFAKNARTLIQKIETLSANEAAIKAKHKGQPVSITEPVPLYMLTAMGLVNKTPAEFSEAIENGTDVAPDVLQQTLQLYSEHAVKLLAYNEQTTGPQTSAVLDAAKSASIPVVPVTETMPQKKNFQGWMQDNITAIGKALGD
jgi:zinc/manganese transport system substrate-binding protein